MLIKRMLAKSIQEHFYVIQIAFGGSMALLAWIFLRPKSPDSGFKLREADLRKPSASRSGAQLRALPGSDPLANAKLKPKGPMLLTGIRIDGAPHEILGLHPSASSDEIQKAYRELMKRYHPDKVGRPGTREWTDAQKIAEALNSAKDALLRKAR